MEVKLTVTLNVITDEVMSREQLCEIYREAVEGALRRQYDEVGLTPWDVAASVANDFEVTCAPN